MEELEFLWSIDCFLPLNGEMRYDLHLGGEPGEGPGDQEFFFVTTFLAYPTIEEVHAAIAMWKVNNG